MPGITIEMRTGETRGSESQSLELNGPSNTSTFFQIERYISTFRDVKYMDQQLIIIYLSRKGRSAVAVHDDLVATLGAEAASYPFVTRYLRKAIFASSNQSDPLPPPKPQLDDSDLVILLALADQTFASIREFSRLTHLPGTTVYRRLTKSLGFCVRHERWAPLFCHAVKSSIK
jgi:hypothetical protein